MTNRVRTLEDEGALKTVLNTLKMAQPLVDFVNVVVEARRNDCFRAAACGKPTA